MSSNEELNENPVSHYELLFNKSSYKSEWDKKSPERSSIVSLTPDEIGHLEHSQEQFGHKSEVNCQIASTSINFLPTMVPFESRVVSFELQSVSNSALTVDSLEETTEKTLGEESEEQTETEEDSLESAQITEQELDNEGCEKEDGNPADYLDKEVFPVLLPCLEKMLFAAKENDVLKVQKSRFNGLDYLAELLWNCNPHHPERHSSHLPLFDIPFVQKHLEENPRPKIPQSWLWTRDEAAIVIQAAIRSCLVRCQPQVQELRQFWKTLAEEKRLAKQAALDEEKPPLEKQQTALDEEKPPLEKQLTYLSEGKHFGGNQPLNDGLSIYSFCSQYLDGKS